MSTIEIENTKVSVKIASLTVGLNIGVKETAFVAEYASMSKYANYNPNTGIVNPIAAKVEYLDKYYKLTHDSIAWYGSYNPATLDTSLGFLNPMISTDIPAYTAPGGTFISLPTESKSNLLTDLAMSVSRTSLSTISADTLFIDLFTFTQLMNGYTQYKDTNVLDNLIASGIYSAIIPVAAWSQIAPTQTTMIACANLPSVWLYNLPMPLTAMNPVLQSFELSVPYVTRSSGISIINSLGIKRLTMPLGTLGEQSDAILDMKAKKK
jgi:hypothetical protein